MATQTVTLATIIPSDHEKAEWHRMATDAYRTGRNDFGHRYSVAAACRQHQPMRLDMYDTLQLHYRRWLIGGWNEVEHPY